MKNTIDTIQTAAAPSRKKMGTRRLKPGLPNFQRGNLTSFVEQTVLSESIKSNYLSFEQYSSLLAVRNLISACICYIIDYNPPRQDWENVYNMLSACIDDNHQVHDNSPLDALIKEAVADNPDAYCKVLYDSALTGGANHIPSTFGKALRIVADYIFI